MLAVAGTGKGQSERQMLLGARIRIRREELGLGQEAMALEAGLHRTYITSLERGQRNPSLETLCKVATAIQMDLGTLVAGLQAVDGRSG
jgi:transcriptional regulator with XRE-family HTH domain